MPSSEVTPEEFWPVELPVNCTHPVFNDQPVQFERWASLNYLVGPNGSGKTTLFNAIMAAARGRWRNRVKVLGTGRLGPLEKSVSQWLGDLTTRLFQEDNLATVYNTLFEGQDTAHQAFQLLEKRLDLRIRVLTFLKHVFKRTVFLNPTRRGLQVTGASIGGTPYQILDECHGLKELITLLTFLYDDTFAILGIDEPELHLHPQFQRFLLDELRAVAGDPSVEGKKLIFLVTHSPILLDLRHFHDLSSVLVFPGGQAPPQRVQLQSLNNEERLKVRQALPSFHAAQRELIFSNVPIVVEGITDSSILLNLAAKLDLPLGAAGIGVAAMGGKYQLFAYRALLSALAKSQARFVLDLDSAVDPQVMHYLDEDPRVQQHLASAGSGERSLSKEAGELITLIHTFIEELYQQNVTLPPLLTHLNAPGGILAESEVAIALRAVQSLRRDGADSVSMRARSIWGKVDLIRAAALAAGVLILSKGSIEAYYQAPPSVRANDFQKQQAFQAELLNIWDCEDVSTLRQRYQELITFVQGAGMLSIPVSETAREPLADLIHLLQTEIAMGRISNSETAQKNTRILAEGYWYICDLAELVIENRHVFRGTLAVKDSLGGQRIAFDQNTRAYQVLQPPVTSDLL
jgi:hypothetical protein